MRTWARVIFGRGRGGHCRYSRSSRSCNAGSGIRGTREHDLTAISGGDMDIHHPDGREGIEHAAGGS